MGNVLIRPQGANTAIGALVVEGGTSRRTAIREEPEPQAQQPQYTHGFLFAESSMVRKVMGIPTQLAGDLPSHQYQVYL